MNKKELRKELEIALAITIHETLNKHNALAGNEIKKAIHGASKLVAKKFYKAITALSEKKEILKKKPALKKILAKKIVTKKETPKATISKKKK